MAFIIKTAKTIRNHWKKSVFATIAVSYGVSYARERFETEQLMRVYCEKAAKYGEQPLPMDVHPRNVTVILNPSANKRKAADDFESYCAPILHLAGLCVTVIKTESEGHAKDLINDVNNTDALIIAGGDGTVSEVVTGLLRRTDENTNGLIPLGVLPLGRTNTVAKFLFPNNDHLERVRQLADAAMAVVEEVIRPINVIKLEVMSTDTKAIYALSGLKWGAYRDAEFKKDSYWVYGALRKYATYLFNGYKSSLTWNCDADINYCPPCDGCSNCAKLEPQHTKWFQSFSKKTPNASNILNPQCALVQNKEISTVDFTISVENESANEETPKLQINIGPPKVDYFEFIKEGWRSENGETRNIKETIEARTVEIQPKVEASDKKEAWFSIDNENYEVKPIKVTVLPKLINVFCTKECL